MQTHEVFNQSPPFENINLFGGHPFLKKLISLAGANWCQEDLEKYGNLMGSRGWIEKGHLANKYPPVFRSHDRFGKRIDQVDFHPAYHEIMQTGMENKLHSLPWLNPKKGSHAARLALNYLHAQNEAGSNCPITMTFSCVPALSKHFAMANSWLPKITAPYYDARNIPFYDKKALTIGMAMTEKQGGTDVRANTSQAKALGKKGNGELYAITGHKWFCSAPMSDAFLTLAQTETGLSCFLMPRWREDGSKNSWEIQRLKDKLGNRSNASSEIEMQKAHAWLIGEEGRGVATIIEMVAMTRYDCMIGSAGLMRRAVAEAVHHAKHRQVMGKSLVEQDLMQQVLADLALESNAALGLAFLASLCIEGNSAQEKHLLRLLLPIGKYWITKRASPLIAEAMECLGGNGYVEESLLPRLYREAPVNAIWEGSGNVQCLDVHRAIQKNPESLDVCLEYLSKQKNKHDLFDQHLERIATKKKSWLSEVSQARILTENLALALQAAILLECEEQLSAEAFIQARLSRPGQLFGATTIYAAPEIIKNFLVE